MAGSALRRLMAEYKQMSQVNPLKLQAGPADLNKIEVPTVGERPGDLDGHNTDIIIGVLIFHHSKLFKCMTPFCLEPSWRDCSGPGHWGEFLWMGGGNHGTWGRLRKMQNNQQNQSKSELRHAMLLSEKPPHSSLTLNDQGTYFEDGVFIAQLTFPQDYPLNPPKMK